MEVPTRICQTATTCDFRFIKDIQDKAMQASFVCCVGNEAVLKAFFKMNDEKLTFRKVVSMASEIQDGAKAAKLTTYSNAATDTTTSVYKVKPAKSAPKREESGETVSGKSAFTFPKGTCLWCSKTGHLAKDWRYIKAKCP